MNNNNNIWNDLATLAERQGQELTDAQWIHRRLCESSLPGTSFAALQVAKVIELRLEADRLMAQLGALAGDIVQGE